MFSFERFSSCENCDGLTVSTAAPATDASGELIYSDEGFTPVFINIIAGNGEKTTVYLSFAKDYFAGQTNDCAAVRNVCFLPFTSDVSVKSSDEIFGSVSIEGAEENEVTLDTGAEITVKAVPTADIYNDILREISGGLDTFDAAMPFMPSAATLARNGNLWNLNDFDFLDLNAPWWDSNATDSLSIGDKVYFTASDMTIMQKIVSSGIAFNKDLMAQYFPDFDIYKAVEDGTWTLDKLYSMSKEITRPLNDDDRMDEDDLWGIIDTGPSFYYGCGEQLISKDAENYPVIAIGADERSINAAVKVLEKSIEKKTWMCTTDDFTDRSNVWNEVVAVFGENRSLFIALHFSAVKKLRPYGVNYGIVPAAKYDEIQDIASIATPVPGGVGSVTTTILAKHLVEAARLRK